LKLLLDTHIVIWALDPAALTEAERKRMAEPGTTLALSAVAVWELRLKWHSFHISGGRKGPVDPAAAELTHPLGHKDPFDELLLVQAREEGMRLLTRDTKFIGHPFAVAGGHV
jgi:PIN domain nuclease of toxin-antitoxin system